MDQWVKEMTRYRRDDEPSQLDLVFTKNPEIVPTSIECLSSARKRDHVMMEIDIHEDEVLKSNDDYKKERRNYAKANFTGLKKKIRD